MRMRTLAAAVVAAGALILTTTGAAGATSSAPSAPAEDVYTLRCEGDVGEVTMSVRKLTGVGPKKGDDPRKASPRKARESSVLPPREGGPAHDAVAVEGEAGDLYVSPSTAGTRPAEVPAGPVAPPRVPSTDGPAEAGAEVPSEVPSGVSVKAPSEGLVKAPFKVPSEVPATTLPMSWTLESAGVMPGGPLLEGASVSCAKTGLLPEGRLTR